MSPYGARDQRIKTLRYPDGDVNDDTGWSPFPGAQHATSLICIGGNCKDAAGMQGNVFRDCMLWCMLVHVMPDKLTFNMLLVTTLCALTILMWEKKCLRFAVACIQRSDKDKKRRRQHQPACAEG